MAETKTTKTEEVKKLNPLVWELPYNEDLLAQVLYIYRSNERKGTANAKTRGDVSGGGKKPWKQKGTGRARAGSSRSPVWVGGGVTFVPNDRNWERKINKKMAKKATCIMLSKRLKDKDIEFFDIKEKEYKELRKEFVKKAEKRTLIVTTSEDLNKAMRNIEKIEIVKPTNLNAKHIVGADKLLIGNEEVKVLEERLTNGK